jgi:drug/metabolite transporter (DMT)-like permease
MGISEVKDKACRSGARALDVRVPLAFFAIYVLWGATFLAIRVAVLAIPPFFTAGLRFFIAGSLLYSFLRLRGQPAPSAQQWRAVAVMAVFMFVLTYGALFWAEQYVPSGVTAVLEAMLPVVAMILEVFIFRQQPFRWRMLAAVALGFCGTALLLLKNAEASFGVFPCLVILAGSAAWTVGAVLTRSMPLPKSVPLAAGAEMMLGGMVLLGISLLTGEVRSLPHISLGAGLALLYLIVGGSLIGFTAYMWLLARMPATRVASHAYVNPLVAVALGYFVAGEEVTSRMLVASFLVVTSVFLILKQTGSQPAPDSRADEVGADDLIRKPGVQKERRLEPGRGTDVA